MREVAGSSPAATTIENQQLARQVITPYSRIVRLLSVSSHPAAFIDPSAEFFYGLGVEGLVSWQGDKAHFYPAGIANYSRIQIDDVFTAS